jgi:hypothetical protein
VDLLRPHAGVAPRTFRSAGGLQYQPNKETFASTRIRPVVAEWLRKTNPLATVAEACGRLGLVLRGRVVCCQSEVLVGRSESVAVKNVFGDVHPSWMCPSNPDVREYLRALLADVSTAYPFATLELAAVSFPPCASAVRVDSPDTSLAGNSSLGPAGDWLLSLCFCESCRQSAAGEGVDAAAAARSATVLLERALASGEPVPKTVEGLLAADAVLRAHADWGCQQVTRLLRILRQACTCRLVVFRNGGTRARACDFPALAAECDGLLVPSPAPLGDSVEPAVAAGLADTGDIAKVEIVASAEPPACPDSAALVKALATAARLGVPAAAVDNYGQMPIHRLAWVKQAVRYATRESQ